MSTDVAGSEWLRKGAAVVRLGRPKFLLGGFALYGLGAMCASVTGVNIDAVSYLWGQVAVTAIQLTTHYSNDYFDYQADRANRSPTQWSGGSRVLVRGELPPSSALWAAGTVAAVACVAMVALFALQGKQAGLAIALLFAMLVLAWSYSSPPLRLHHRGGGEPTVALVVPFMTPLSGYVVQSGGLHPLPIILSLPLVLLQIVMLVVLEFPDAEGDRAVGKRSWVVLFGERRMAWLCESFIVGAFAISFASVPLGLPSAVGWAWLFLLPLGLVQLGLMLRGNWKKPEAWEGLAFGSVALFFLAMVADLAALAYVAGIF